MDDQKIKLQAFLKNGPSFTYKVNQLKTKHQAFSSKERLHSIFISLIKKSGQ
jgi:hypothetical protein